jgi:hypothetical protein
LADQQAGESNAWTEGGLQKIDVKGLDVVYARPGATLAGYTKVLLKPISVSFHKDWAKNMASGTNRQISASDQQRIRDNLAKLVHEELVKELNAGGYSLVTSPGDDVLGVEMAIVNLWVTAPDVTTPGKKASYAVTAGEMSLVIELRDSASGDVIARAFDRFKATEYPRSERITRADNIAEARSAASGWAKALRTGLDRAKGIDAK